MTEVISLFIGSAFIGIGVSVGISMILIMRIFKTLWRIPRLRKILVGIYAITPWVPICLGGVYGSFSFWEKPALFSDSQYSTVLMVGLGVASGLFYEKIWKGVKQGMESREIDVLVDLPPKDQIRLKPY